MFTSRGSTSLNISAKRQQKRKAPVPYFSVSRTSVWPLCESGSKLDGPLVWATRILLIFSLCRTQGRLNFSTFRKVHLAMMYKIISLRYLGFVCFSQGRILNLNLNMIVLTPIWLLFLGAAPRIGVWRFLKQQNCQLFYISHFGCI